MFEDSDLIGQISQAHALLYAVARSHQCRALCTPNRLCIGHTWKDYGMAIG
jgi:hypothetical protein